MGNVLTILGRVSISLQMSLSQVETGPKPLLNRAHLNEGQIGLQQQVEINPKPKSMIKFPRICNPLFKKPGGSRFVEGNQTRWTENKVVYRDRGKPGWSGTSRIDHKSASTTWQCVRKLHERGQQVLSCFLCIKNNSENWSKITLCTYSVPY